MTKPKVRVSRLTELRLERGLSQREVALALGTSRRMISYIEHDERGLSLKNRLKLARLYEVDVTEISNEAKGRNRESRRIRD